MENITLEFKKITTKKPISQIPVIADKVVPLKIKDPSKDLMANHRLFINEMFCEMFVKI